MVRLLFCFFVENRGRLELLGIVLVVEVDGAVERERIEDRRFGIRRVVLVQALHRLFVAFGAGLVVDLVVISVEGLDRSEVLCLAGRLRLAGFALMDRFQSRFEVCGREGRHQRIGQFAHR